MSSSGFPALVIFDLIVVGMIFLTLLVSISKGVFSKGRTPRAGRFVVFAGLMVAGLFFVYDLVAAYLMTGVEIGDEAKAAAAAFDFDYRRLGWVLSTMLLTTAFFVIALQRRDVEEKLSRNESLIAAAGERISESEARFQSVLERSVDSVYCFEFNPSIPVNLPIEEQIDRSFAAEMVVCNSAFAKSIGKESREEAIGMLLGDMSSIMSPQSYKHFYRTFVEHDYQLDEYEFEYVDIEGNKQLYLVSAAGEIENGSLVRLWGSEKNILEQAELRDTLIGRLTFQEFVMRISSQLLLAQPDEIESVLAACLKEICHHLKADRITIVWLDIDKRTAEPLYYWNELGRPAWQKISMDDFPFMGSKLMTGAPVIIDSVDDMTEEFADDSRRLAASGIKALIALPLFIAGDVTGVCTLGVVNDRRHWTDYDVSDLQYFSGLIANVVFRINAKKELSRALVEVESMKDRLEAENIYLRQEISLNTGFDELIGQSESLRSCLHQVQQVAGTKTTVLVQGETGTGKELIVRAIHQLGDRSERPLVKVNCAALPSELIESELFGHEKGAFTGAVSRKRGRFDLADGGTLFLDEIGDFPYALQGRLLRVLQEGEFQRVGGTETLQVDVRLIAATNRNLSIAVDCGKFRADLFYRIGVYPIDLPALRDRQGDIQLLAEHFVHKHAANLGKRIDAISAAMMDKLLAHSWPGNVRELESVIQRSLISATGPVLQLTEILGADLPRSASGFSEYDSQSADLGGVEKAHIERVLDQAGWVIAGGTGAATKLGVPPSTLRSKMKKLGIHRPS